MYSKEQMATRLKLGATISTSELVLVVKSLMEKVEELEKKIEIFSNKDIQTKVETNEQVSEDRRGTDKDTRKDVSSFSLRSIFKQ
jgi:hypothetical protein